MAVDPNANPSRGFLNYLEEGTRELQAFVTSKLVKGDVREIDRITRYALYRKFYDGQHYRDYNETMLSFNYVKAFIDKVNHFLLGETGFSFKVASYYNSVIDKDTEKIAEELLMYHWNRNNKMVTIYEILQMGSITGDCWVMGLWVSDKKYVELRVLDSQQSYPEFENGDTSKLVSFMVRIPMEENKDKYKIQVYRYTETTVEIWYQKDTSLDWKTAKKEKLVTETNNYGFIPVVHIKNKPSSGSYYGKSDMHDILKINKVYNELNQELKAIIDYYVTPITIVTGASMKNIKKGVGKIWSGLPPEANVFNLGLDVDISAMTEYAKLLKTSMHEISDVPENVLGKTQAISGTSAAALKLTYQPLVQQAQVRALMYGEGVADINEMILRLIAIYDPSNIRFTQLKGLSFIEEMRVIPIFAYAFPQDKMIRLQEGQMELQLGVGSKSEIMNDLGKENIPDLLVQIAQEKITDAQLQAVLLEISGQNEDPTQANSTNPAPPQQANKNV